MERLKKRWKLLMKIFCGFQTEATQRFLESPRSNFGNAATSQKTIGFENFAVVVRDEYRDDRPKPVVIPRYIDTVPNNTLYCTMSKCGRS